MPFVERGRRVATRLVSSKNRLLSRSSSSFRAARQGPGGPPRGPGCCAWSASGPCAGTSRTRSGRSSRRETSKVLEQLEERLGLSTGVQQEGGDDGDRDLGETPSAPSPRRAAWKSSGSSVAEHVTTDPSASTRRSARMRSRVPADAARCRACRWRWLPRGLAVDVAEVGQRVAERGSSALSTWSGVPARTVASPRVASIEVTPVRAPRRSWTPSVTATPVNEWPAPIALTRRPRAVARPTSS